MSSVARETDVLFVSCVTDGESLLFELVDDSKSAANLWRWCLKLALGERVCSFKVVLFQSSVLVAGAAEHPVSSLKHKCLCCFEGDGI